MSIVRIANTTIAGTGGGAGPFTSASQDTTGANFIARVMAASSGNNPAITDNQSNSWSTAISINDPTTTFQIQLNFAWNAIVNAAQTFTIGGLGSSFISEEIAAFSNIKVSGAPIDVGAIASSNASASTTIQAGSITPANNGSLIIAGVAWTSTSTMSIDSGFTISDQQPLNVSNYYGSALAWFVQSVAAPINPTWTLGLGTSNMAAVIAAFAPGPSGTLFSQILG